VPAPSSGRTLPPGSHAPTRRPPARTAAVRRPARHTRTLSTHPSRYVDAVPMPRKPARPTRTPPPAIRHSTPPLDAPPPASIGWHRPATAGRTATSASIAFASFPPPRALRAVQALATVDDKAAPTGAALQIFLASSAIAACVSCFRRPGERPVRRHPDAVPDAAVRDAVPLAYRPPERSRPLPAARSS